LKPCLGLKIGEIEVGYQMVQDYAGNTDYCVTQQQIPGAPKTLPTSCPAGHTKTVRRGKDLCKAPDLIATACGGSRDGCRWTFNLGLEYSRLSNPALGRIYGQNTSQPVNNAASSVRRHAGDPNLRK
jgi:hypothetical protein